MVTGTMNNDYQHIDPVGLLPKVFAGEASPEETRLVEEWRAADPENQAEYDAIAKLWNISGEAAEPGEIDLDAEWRRMEAAMDPGLFREVSGDEDHANCSVAGDYYCSGFPGNQVFRQ